MSFVCTAEPSVSLSDFTSERQVNLDSKFRFGTANLVQPDLQRAPEFCLNTRPCLTGRREGGRKTESWNARRRCSQRRGLVPPFLLRKNLPPSPIQFSLSLSATLLLRGPPLARCGCTVCLHFHPRFQRPRSSAESGPAAVNVNVSHSFPPSNVYESWGKIM